MPTHDPGYFSNIRPEIIEFVPQDVKKVLEVGCGYGFFGAMIKQRNGAEVWGVESNIDAAAEAVGRLDKVVEDNFEEGLDLPAGYFDCLVFNDVLEHLVEPEEALEYGKTLLSEGGVVVASIPNVRYIKNVVHLVFGGDWKYTQDGILDRTHLRFFTHKSIIRLIGELGGEILAVKGINPTRSKFFKLFNIILFKRFDDMKYMQIVTVFRF
ncbi:hypothetical protein CEE37_01090 [candidate division LCP-89 bacterium B3_LCP]|uniref:Class I SAM-dependent methyltransferase n=1 Tax=candidate division LCP-89 bacterium B3_LCP TaxID=2012998 RepID=A0A532V523_UNCL8|nr:MAG: hypothetical protein CEE37_01090 [candidate division LCP-89 bacterium B3_LCP]